jgi:hypothetical protein
VTEQPPLDHETRTPLPLDYGRAQAPWRRWGRWLRCIHWRTWILILLIAPSIANFWINTAVWIRHDPGLGTKRYPPLLPSCICASPDESRLAFRARDSVHVIDSKSGREIFHTQSPAEFIAISHDGRRLFTAGQGQPVCIFDLTSAQKLAQIPGADNRTTEAMIAVSNDGSRLIVRSNDSITLWDSTSGKKIRELVNTDRMSRAVWINFTGNDRFATVACDDEIEYYRAANGILDHACPLPDSCFSSGAISDIYALATDRQNQLHWIDSPSGVQRFVVPIGAGGGEFQLTPDGRRLICASMAGLTLVDTTNGKIIRSLPSLPGPPGTYWYLSRMSPDGRLIAANGSPYAFPGTYKTTILDTHTLATAAVIPGTLFEGSSPFSPDGSRIVVSDGLFSSSVLKTTTWKPVSQLISGLPMSGFNSGEFSWYASDNIIITSSSPRDPGGSFCYWTKHRPDAWYGLAELPQCWLALGVTLMAALSFLRDIRMNR